MSTTMVCKAYYFAIENQNIRKNIVPIVPDEARTFGMDGLFDNWNI